MDNHQSVNINNSKVAADQTDSIGDDIDPLCCCEYFNRNDERYHILECCCNCTDFDQVFDRLICCKKVDPKHSTGMLLTFQDRLRVPWQGGAKQISLDAIVPMLVIPLVIGIAAINSETALIMCIATTLLLGYCYYYLRRTVPRTRFFVMWTFWSVFYLIILFEFTVPMMELLPEENFFLVLLASVTMFCFYRVKTRANLNHVPVSIVSEDELPDITEEQTSLLIDNSESDEGDHHHPNVCQVCHKYVQPRTFHCTICQACVERHDHHSYWLDCCVGDKNHLYYFLGLLFANCALLFGANLATTAVCHPVLVFKFMGVPVLVPDDCNDVFDDYETSLAFIMAIYALIMNFFVLIALIMQMYLISKGITLSEWRRGQSGNRRSILNNLKCFFIGGTY
ncbi:palmitoyltransferase ZDHHC23-B [Episyrphus balteatus]|uniref:palmitoyltransferase ZDHHC23-B n=1 Tax=Episyrphus balteatus TaxID=286459 RepID=UPI00248631A3|nr:palmitoyltransferase ZDHHC23-B [Episyrphus balteatus]